MKTNKHLIISGTVFTIVLILWPVFMSISQPQGTDEQQLQWLLNNITIYKIQFFFAFLLSPSIIYLIMAQLDKYPSLSSIRIRTGLVFLTGYFVLNTISYGSQMTYIPKLVEAGLFDHAIIWYFGSSASVTYFINQMGYCFWGVGVLILFFSFIKEKGMIKYISIIYFVSGIENFYRLHIATYTKPNKLIFDPKHCERANLLACESNVK